MYSFDARMGSAVTNSTTKGWLVAILELGAWFGVLCTGYLADKLSRKRTIVLGNDPPIIPEVRTHEIENSRCGVLRWCRGPDRCFPSLLDPRR